MSSQKFDRRKFIFGSATLVAGTSILSQAEKTFAQVTGLGAFWQQPTKYSIGQSLRFASVNSAYLSWTPTSAGNRKKWTWSGWFKRSSLSRDQVLFGAYDNSAGSNSIYTALTFFSDDTLSLSGWNVRWRVTSRVFRDPGAWYHIVCSVDTTDAVAANRVKIFCNGVQVTSFSESNDPTISADLGINATNMHCLGRVNYTSGSGPYPFDGYMAEVNFVDGQALDSSYFGKVDTTTGQWVSKRYNGTYGTNGFYLKFADNSNTTSTTLGKDSSANNNNWTPVNLQAHDQVLDSPTNNFCTLNWLSNNGCTINNGALRWVEPTTGSNYAQTAATLGVSFGKWYWEDTVSTLCGVSGFRLDGTAYDLDPVLGNHSQYGYVTSSSGSYTNGEACPVGSYAGTVYTAVSANDVIGIAIDVDAGKAWFSINNVWVNSGNPATGAGAVFTAISKAVPWFPALCRLGGLGGVHNLNFGQGGQPGLTYYSAAGGRFKYSPPSGFKALSTFHLSNPTIKNPAQYFDILAYAGVNTTTSGSVDQGSAKTGLKFSPDLVWMKARNEGTLSYLLRDSVRGASVLSIPSSAASSAANGATLPSGYIKSLDPNGFTLGRGNSGATPWRNVDETGYNYVGWCWRKSAASGFDIIQNTLSSTGINTISHSLGATPKMILAKTTGVSENWFVYSATLTTSEYLTFSTSAKISSAGLWGTGPTTSQFQFNGTAGRDYIFYLFAEVPGYSRIDYYTGNGASPDGSADGPFVYCGFKPKYLLLKRIDSTSSWVVLDSARNSYNVQTNGLYPNLLDAEGSGDFVDFLSNGFKIRDSGVGLNAPGGKYIYIAFAEAPFKYASAM
ncbi:MAG: hypothetical protein OM95_05470 [Bdellovibrio sp. ArHS]|uniref:DUF7483 domain-containing protein n=1 Tax=Bdellovibrio sp. ArHS TaxID=1569284 RepID=UPI000583274F|nr:hypothetical protein [Bdellovibrio sp. ArHS]KHD88927.1 MAG: hypothetical protein OM95_05470 [Bdellovibrio sp. ArHS]